MVNFIHRMKINSLSELFECGLCLEISVGSSLSHKNIKKWMEWKKSNEEPWVCLHNFNQGFFGCFTKDKQQWQCWRKTTGMWMCLKNTDSLVNTHTHAGGAPLCLGFLWKDVSSPSCLDVSRSAHLWGTDNESVFRCENVLSCATYPRRLPMMVWRNFLAEICPRTFL